MAYKALFAGDNDDDHDDDLTLRDFVITQFR
jgi:hypothetical protein